MEACKFDCEKTCDLCDLCTPDSTEAKCSTLCKLGKEKCFWTSACNDLKSKCWTSIQNQSMCLNMLLQLLEFFLLAPH